MNTKTGVLMVYHPHGTKSALCIELQYREKTKHQITVPKFDKDQALKTMREWAKNAGFTHVRFFGEFVISKL